MCGINGILYADNNRPVDERTLIAMRDVMVHRGPDDGGGFLDGNVGLGHRRLSIIDLSERGRQPMSAHNGRYWIVYNGEVYNFRELRAELEQKGINFYSGTDTEALLHLYANEGACALRKLNGMFAIAIWDTHERTLFLARDRLGVKPLYYYADNDMFLFASEAKAFKAAGVRLEFDESCWEELLLFRYIAGERSVYKNIKRLLPGHFLTWKDGKISIVRWWNLAERAGLMRETLPPEPSQWFAETFDSSVKLRTISDVPLGVLLSGGLDSGSVAASLAAQTHPGVASFTVRFAEKAYDEGPIAQQIATAWNLQRHELILSPHDVMDTLKRAAWFSDEPIVHQNNAHLLAISEYAKPHVTILLSGEGGDETLSGYVRYTPLRYPKLLALSRMALPAFNPLLPNGTRLKKLSRFVLLKPHDRFVLFNACNVFPDDLSRIGVKFTGQFPYRESVLSEGRGLYPGDLARQLMYLDQHTFLQSLLDRNDRMTMGASIECRVPFLDYRLLETLAALSTDCLINGTRNKSLLRSALGHRLPEDVLAYRKWGFGIPWTTYFRNQVEFRHRIRDLSSHSVFHNSPIDRTAIHRMSENFLNGSNRDEMLIQQLFMITVWSDEHCIR